MSGSHRVPVRSSTVVSGAAFAIVLAHLLVAPTPVEAQAGASGTDRPVEVSWRPERPVQGHLMVLRVAPGVGAGPTAVEGVAGGERLHFEAAGSGAFESLAPVPITAEGSLDVRIEVRMADGTTRVLTPEVPVDAGSYRHESLTVAPRLGGPLSDADAARLRQDQARAAAVARRAHATPRLWTASPVLPREDRVTSGFGNGRIYNGQVSGRHMGLDLDGDPGALVVAPTRGVVALVDSFLLAGNIVYLVHGGGLLSGYFHLSEALVAEGDTVEAGTPIGRVGATGRVTGPHLHWVVRYGTTSLDPRSLAPALGASPPAR